MFPFADRIISLFTFSAFDGQEKQFIITMEWPEEPQDKKQQHIKTITDKEKGKVSHTTPPQSLAQPKSHFNEWGPRKKKGGRGGWRVWGGGEGRWGYWQPKAQREPVCVPFEIEPRGDATALSMWHIQNNRRPTGAWALLMYTDC